MTYETKERKDIISEKYNQIGEKKGRILLPSSKLVKGKQENLSTRTSAKSSSVLIKKNRKTENEKQKIQENKAKKKTTKNKNKI